MIIWSVYLYVFCRLRTAIFVPRGKRSDWIFINVFFFLLIYRKRKFCAEPMRERLTFHFGLGTRSVNLRFFFSFLLFFLFVFSNQGKISSCNTTLLKKNSLKSKANKQEFAKQKKKKKKAKPSVLAEKKRKDLLADLWREYVIWLFQ